MLKKLDLSNNHRPLAFVEKIDKGCRFNIEELNISDMSSRTTAAQVRKMVECCKNLKKLDISWCRGIADFVAGLSVSSGMHLVGLNLAYTDATAVQIAAIINRFPMLKKLDVSEANKKERSVFMAALEEGRGRQLEKLSLSMSLTKVEKDALRDRFPLCKF